MIHEPKRPPLVLGGQGRSPQSLRRDAANVRWLLVVAVLLVLCYLTRKGES